MLRLGGEVFLGGALLCLGGPESSENLGSGSPRSRGVGLKQKWPDLAIFTRNLTKTNHFETKLQN